ncbi:hypothetical protein AWB65_01446 [Caballeronia humi]|uniref:Uncharacterized protein n=1 Tax=Caballeronia humi TaxID=326474 RepID=A0A158G1N5_9BURK|nr:hypothetical protein AWB65_01446 [Caballeronia humi]
MYIGILVPQSRQIQDGAPHHADMSQGGVRPEFRPVTFLQVIQRFLGKIL